MPKMPLSVPENDATHAMTVGFIAQELYEIFPGAMTTNGAIELSELVAHV